MLDTICFTRCVSLLVESFSFILASRSISNVYIYIFDLGGFRTSIFNSIRFENYSRPAERPGNATIAALSAARRIYSATVTTVTVDVIS